MAIGGLLIGCGFLPTQPLVEDAIQQGYLTNCTKITTFKSRPNVDQTYAVALYFEISMREGWEHSAIGLQTSELTLSDGRKLWAVYPSGVEENAQTSIPTTGNNKESPGRSNAKKADNHSPAKSNKGKVITASGILLLFSILFSAATTPLGARVPLGISITVTGIKYLFSALFFLSGFFALALTRQRLVKSLIMIGITLIGIVFFISLSDGNSVGLLASFIGFMLLLISFIIISNADNSFVTDGIQAFRNEIKVIGWVIVIFSGFGILKNILTLSFIEFKVTAIMLMLMNFFEFCMGIFILRLKNWARKTYALLVPLFWALVLYFGYLGIKAGPKIYISLELLLPSILLYVFALWVLFRSQAADLFGSTRRIL